jgi:hypothetical protein
MTEIWKHYDGYAAARAFVQAQTLEEDLATIDALYGRDALRYGATPEEVKEEALRQTEREWRSERNEVAELWVKIANADRAWRR